MPYASRHYPFENKELVERSFPADFIAEGLDQTRGWFYTLTVLSNALFQKPAFKNVIVNGIILAEDGSKMSKSKRNYPDPNDLIERTGADAIRLFMINSAALKAEDLRFSEEGVKGIVKQVMLPLWNAVAFFVSNHNADAAKGQLTWKPVQAESSEIAGQSHCRGEAGCAKRNPGQEVRAITNLTAGCLLRCRTWLPRSKWK